VAASSMPVIARKAAIVGSTSFIFHAVSIWAKAFLAACRPGTGVSSINSETRSLKGGCVVVVSEVINCLLELKEQYGDLQVALYDDGSCSHSPIFHFEVNHRADEVNDPVVGLDDVFIGIH